ncbi:hypothetical protein HZZ00_14785 [Streptomyces sp. NEAU-sy36]|uniref:hypothetical protein n=1 Tax=unclassified Streptomyces TaxID=2593676 RepID=UPI0015D5EB03|nr:MULTISPECIES: hypothetical protein [unclassified Streptomyces]QLJ02172.1 hypothetical protein HZZ00_14785 [Streptomyces sp. NEAU-sy36]
MAWSVYRRTVAEVVAPRPEWVLFAGVSIGFADPAVTSPQTGRAPLAETVTFVDGS